MPVLAQWARIICLCVNGVTPAPLESGAMPNAVVAMIRPPKKYE